MGTMTAQFLIGSGYPHHGGIIPTHYLFLSENSRPALVLLSQNIYDNTENTPEDKIIWIPSLENMLEDALLMIALYVIRDEQLLKLARKYIKFFGDNRIEVYQDIFDEGREKFYHACRLLGRQFKIVLSVYEGSSLLTQLQKLTNYQMEVEVLLPVYLRYHSPYQNKIVTRGSLEEEG